MVDERLLEGMQVLAIGRQPLDGDDLVVRSISSIPASTSASWWIVGALKPVLTLTVESTMGNA